MANQSTQYGKLFVRNAIKLQQESEISIGQMAQATGVSTRTLYRIKHASQAKNGYNPMLKTVAKLATASNTTVDNFVNTRLDFQ